MQTGRGWLALTLALVLGGAASCSGDKDTTDTGHYTVDSETDSETDSEADADADADADSDTDADSDADSDADTDTTSPVDCADAGAEISLAEFQALFADEYCWWWDTAGCPGSGTCAAPSFDDCVEFSPSAACDCLDGAWGCDPNTGEPHSPPVCGEVCKFGYTDYVEDTDADLDADADSDSDTDVDTDADADSDGDTDTDADSDSDSDTDTSTSTSVGTDTGP